MAGFVYVWFDRKHKRYYVGSHWGTPDDGYVCSSTWMLQAYKRRPQDFKRRIVAWRDDRTSLLEEERRWLNMTKPEELKGLRYYNLATQAAHWSAQGTEKLKTVGAKISAAKATPEAKARQSEISIANWQNPEFRSQVTNKISKTLTGRAAPWNSHPLSEDHKKKLSEVHSGRPPRMNSAQKVCPHCQRGFNLGNYSRYHGDRCIIKTETKVTT